jgi:hypothetical protein
MRRRGGKSKECTDLVQQSAVHDGRGRELNVRVEGFQLIEDGGGSAIQLVVVWAVGTGEEGGLDLCTSACLQEFRGRREGYIPS